MRQPPPDVVASWPAPNYTDPETRGPALVIVELIAVSISTTCLALRLYVKSRIVRRIDLDDWLILGAAFFGAGVTICIILASSRYGWDMHIWDMPQSEMVASRQISFASQALFIVAAGLAKISIFVSYLHLAPRDSWFRRLSVIGVWVTVLASLSFIIVLFTQCRPLRSYWDVTLRSRDCFNEAPTLLAHATVTALLDCVLWVLPLPTLYHTRLPLSQRLALIALFSFGFLVVLAGCMRIYWVHYVVQETYDVTWYGFQLWIWTAVEVQLGLICACVPWLKPLYKFWKTGRRGAGAGGGAQSDKQRGKEVKEAAVVKGDKLGNVWACEGLSSEGYIDLERCSAGGGSQAPVRLSDISWGPPAKPADWC